MLLQDTHDFPMGPLYSMAVFMLGRSGRMKSEGDCVSHEQSSATSLDFGQMYALNWGLHGV
jgi:hypothetical protein